MTDVALMPSCAYEFDRFEYGIEPVVDELDGLFGPEGDDVTLLTSRPHAPVVTVWS
jgi:hypothetical protein